MNAPIRRVLPLGCARAATGQIPAALPMSMMNSRRFG